MSRLLCLLGKSGVGKSTLFNKIICNYDLGVEPIITYTTRPKRDNEIDGMDYNFVSQTTMNRMEAEGRIVEKRKYTTAHGAWYYFTENFDLGFNRIFITITTPEGVKNLAEKIDKSTIIIIYLEADNTVRMERLLQRESGQRQPSYDELNRRFLADDKDFGIDLDEFTSFRIGTANLEPDECFSRFKEILYELNWNFS